MSYFWTQERNEKRFWKKVIKNNFDACQNWQGFKIRGYGQTSWKGKNILTHRLAYLLVKGEIPNGLFVCHSCDNPSCCNPAHLWLGTKKENAEDSTNKGRRYRTSHSQRKKMDVLFSVSMSQKKIAEWLNLNKRTIHLYHKKWRLLSTYV